MHLPKQAAPIQRLSASSPRVNGQAGIDPSISRQDIMDFLEGVRLGQTIVDEVLLRPIPNILQSLGPLFSIL